MLNKILIELHFTLIHRNIIQFIIKASNILGKATNILVYL